MQNLNFVLFLLTTRKTDKERQRTIKIQSLNYKFKKIYNLFRYEIAYIKNMNYI